MRNLHTISTVVAPIQIPTNSIQGFSFLCILTNSCYFLVSFDASHSNRYEVMYPGGFNLHLSVMIGVAEHLYMYLLAMLTDFLIAQLVKNLPAIRETWVRSLGWENTLEKGKATQSMITSLKKNICQLFYPFFKISFFFLFAIVCIICICWILNPYQTYNLKIFSSSLVCFFILLMASWLCRSNYFIFLFTVKLHLILNAVENGH